MRWNILFGALGIIIIDQLSKAYITASINIPNTTIQVIPKIFHITYVKNYGIGFGLLQGLVPFIIAASIVIIIGLLYYMRDIPDSHFINTTFALLLGGSIGNLIDRIAFGYVIDFLDFRIWPVFNVADSAVTIGGILLVVWLYKEDR